ncbi:unnamed protein product, partial [Mesorhabditis belari]|uniref:Molybdopterin synthase sulfur carrier subunit n=1 Tax=Mesorhabditis belari TaxID=2138241 RepID=A0AAF3J669_9BILA
METIPIRVLFFGKAREIVKCDEQSERVPVDADYQRLFKMIFEERFPELKEIASSCMLAVDQHFCRPDSKVELYPNSEIAVIPPLSGG